MHSLGCMSVSYEKIYHGCMQYCAWLSLLVRTFSNPFTSSFARALCVVCACLVYVLVCVCAAVATLTEVSTGLSDGEQASQVGRFISLNDTLRLCTSSW